MGIIESVERIENNVNESIAAAANAGANVPAGARSGDLPGLINEVGATVVRTTPQTFTDEQKTKARENIGAQPAGNYLTTETDPTVPSWAKQPSKPSYSASEVGAAALASPNNMLHNGNEYTFIPAGYTGELYINYRTESGATDGKISNYHFCNGAGGGATIIAGYLKGKFQGDGERPEYNGKTVAMLSDIPSKTENWTFTLEDGSTVTKAVYLK